jgi:hypothetical protein
MKSTTNKKKQELSKKVDDRFLKTPQSVIHIKHHISLRQYKYWILALDIFRESYKNNIEPDSKGLYRSPIERLAEYIGYTPTKEELKQDFESLRKEPIIVNVLNKDGKPVQRGMGFISEWEITSKTIGFRLPVFIEDVVRGLDETCSIFQLLNWDIFNHFSGKYEAIIYKLCRDYVGVRRTPYMTIEEFRDYMGLQSTEYPDFKRLGQRLIYEPCNAINKSVLSDISVTPHLEKKGRKVIGISFHVEPRRQGLIPIIELPKEPHAAFAAAKIPILPKIQDKYLSLRTEKEIILCIERVNQYGEKQEQEGKPPNYGALYHKAIEEGWHIDLADKKSTEKSEHVKKNAEAIAKQQAAADEKARTEKNLAEREAVLAQFRALPINEQEATIASFLATDASARAGYKRRGFDSPIFLFPFLYYLKHQGNPIHLA